MKKDTGESRGYGFVGFDTVEAARTTLHSSVRKILMPIKMKLALPPTPSPNPEYPH